MSTPLLNCRFSFVAICLAFVLAVPGYAVTPANTGPVTGVRWETDINVAIARAEREQRPLFLHFVVTSAPATLEMVNNVFTVPGIAAQLNANYVMVRVNASENPALAQRFSITDVPTDLIMHPNGQIIHQRTGAIPAEQFAGYLAFLQNTIQANAAIQANRELASAQSVATPTAPPATSITAGPFPIAASATPPPSHPTSPGMTPPGAVPPGTMPHGTMPPQHHPRPALGNDPFIQQSSAVQSSQTMPAQFAAPSPQAVPPPQMSGGMMSPPPPPPSNNPLRTNEMAGAPAMGQTPMQPTAPHHPGIDPLSVAGNSTGIGSAGIVASANLPAPTKKMVEVPLALEGFCPVTLHTKESWLPGNPAFATMYEGHIFRFATLEDLRTFAQNPASYVPVAMGEDIVLIVDRGRRVNGNRDFAAYFQGRILLFSNQETYNAFAAHPEHYMDIALRYETARRGPQVPVVF